MNEGFSTIQAKDRETFIVVFNKRIGALETLSSRHQTKGVGSKR